MKKGLKSHEYLINRTWVNKRTQTIETSRRGEKAKKRKLPLNTTVQTYSYAFIMYSTK